MSLEGPPEKKSKQEIPDSEIEKKHLWAKYLDRLLTNEKGERIAHERPEDAEHYAHERIKALRERLEKAINDFQHHREIRWIGGEEEKHRREWTIVNPGLSLDELEIIAFERGVPPPKPNPDGSFRMLLGYGDIGGGNYDYYLEQSSDPGQFWQEVTREEVITQANRRPSEDPHWLERQTIHQRNPDVGKIGREAPIQERGDEGWLDEKERRNESRPLVYNRTNNHPAIWRGGGL